MSGLDLEHICTWHSGLQGAGLQEKAVEGLINAMWGHSPALH